MTEKRYRKLLNISYVSIVFCLCAIVLLSTLLIYSFHAQREICTSKACIKAANMIMANIDTSVDPCENFYEFSCGNFLKTKRIPDKQPKIDIFDDLRNNLAYNVANLLSEPIHKSDIEPIQKIKRLYKSCMDEDNIEKHGEETLLEFINDKLGGWPILSKKIVQNTKKEIEKISALRLVGVSAFFDISVISNPKQPEQSVLKLKQPNWLVNKEIYNDSKIVPAYKKYMLTFLTYLGSKSTNLETEIDNVFELEKQLGMIQSDERLKRNATYTNTTIAGLQNDVPDFPWEKLILDGFYSNVGENETIIYANETILVDNWDYIVKAVEIYKDYVDKRKRDLDNFYIWKFIKDKAPYLPKKYKVAKLEYEKIVKGTREMQSSSLLCSNSVIAAMEYAVGRVYVEKHFDSTSKNSAIKMIGNILEEFKLMLKEVDWMDDISKSKALAKANAIDSKIGYPEFIKNDTFLSEMYEDYSITHDEYFLNKINITIVNNKNLFKNLKFVKNIKTWFIGPAVVNAFYSPSANQICFPAGILQAPFYDSTSPKYLNYGSIGSVIGHEITHGFDDRGRLYDKDGIYFPDTESLWTNNTIKRYKEKVQCIIDQYSGFSSKQVNRKLNGIQSQGENIADNGGVKESFRAYKRWVKKNGNELKLPGLPYTPEQLFFINYGQIWCSKYRDQYLITRILNGHHSPGEFRIIGPTSNSHDFARTFQCKRNQKNNPVKKCSVW